MNLSLLTATGSLVLTGTMACGIAFFSSFESASYEAGKSLAGQDGWVSLLSPNGAKIIDDTTKARSGRRAIECWGGGELETVSLPFFDLLDGAWEQVVQFDENEQPAVVRVAADIRLDGPDTGDGPNDDLLSANLYARNGSNRSAFFFLSSNGNAYAFANSETAGSQGYRFETPIKQGAYNHLEIVLDYRDHMATFVVNGEEVGKLPFGGSGEEFRGALLEFASLDIPALIDPADYTAYWDNVSVVGHGER